MNYDEYNDDYQSKDWIDCTPSEQAAKFSDLEERFDELVQEVMKLRTDKTLDRNEAFASGQVKAIQILKNGEIEELKATIAEREAEITRLKATITQLTAENIALKEKEKNTFAVHNSNQDAFDEWKRRLDRSNATD